MKSPYCNSLLNMDITTSSSTDLGLLGLPRIVSSSFRSYQIFSAQRDSSWMSIRYRPTALASAEPGVSLNFVRVNITPWKNR